MLTIFLTVGAQFIPPRYTSTVSVVVESRTPRTVGGLEPEKPFTDVTMGTELAILDARQTFERTVNTLNLMSNPEFNGSLDTSPLTRWRRSALAWGHDLLGHARKPATNVEFYDTVDELRRHVQFTQIPLSRIIKISVTSESSTSSARIATVIATVFIEHHEELSQQTNNAANEYLAQRLQQLRTEAERASRAAEQYRVDHGLLIGGSQRSGKDTMLAQEQASQITEQLSAARDRLVGLLAARETARSGNTEALSRVIASPTIGKMREIEVNIALQRALASAKYGAQSELLKPLDNQLASVRRNIQEEIQRHVQSLDTDVAAAQDSMARLTSDLAHAITRLNDMGAAAAPLETLLTESTAAQVMYAAFLSRAKETDALRLYTEISVRIVSAAVAPPYPSFPQNKIVVPSAAMLSMLLGCCLALVLDRHRIGFVNGEELANTFHTPVLGLIPGRQPAGHGPYAMAFQDAIERLLSRLLQQDHKVILITSALSHEGKSTVAQALAEAASARQLRVLLLQADFRSIPSPRSSAGPSVLGFSDVLSGTTTAQAAMQSTPTADGARLMLIPLGRLPSNPTRLLARPQLAQSLAVLRNDFDVVIVDTPPALEGGDCWLLAQNADFSVLLVRAETTPRDTVSAALAELQGARLGLVLNMVSSRLLSHRAA